MAYRYFLISIHDDGSGAEALNKFLASHKIIEKQQQFVQDGPRSGWAVSVEYYSAGGDKASAASEKNNKVDYKEILSEPEFQVFSKLRVLRKELSERDGVPVYAVFNNQQLAEMVQQRVNSLQGLQAVEGVGEGRVKKYGERFLSTLQAEFAALPPSARGHGREA
jgi:superfamily II DNA helicase RecQ